MAAQAKRFAGRPAGDTGAADPAVAHALDAWQRGDGSEHAALLALSGTRLLVPVVALYDPGGRPPVDSRQEGDSVPPFTPLAPEGQSPPDRGTLHHESEMALPTLIGNDGRAAIIAFTGLEALARWRPDARPVVTPAARAWQAAQAEGNAVVIDVAGPVPFAVEGARLAALAAGGQPPPAHLDPDVRAAVAAAVAAEPAIEGFTLAPGDGAEGPGGDLAVLLRVTDATGIAAARRAARAITMSLSPRLRRGITLSVAA
jgi:hypothetical protein